MRGPGSRSAFQFTPKVFRKVEIRALCRPPGSSIANSSNNVVTDLVLCTGAQSLGNRKGLPQTAATRIEANN